VVASNYLLTWLLLVLAGIFEISWVLSAFVPRNYVMAWLILIIAGIFEIGWAVGLKATHGFSLPVPSLVYASMIISVILLGLTMKVLPIGTAYAVWTGIGTIGTVLLGRFLLGESLTCSQVICIGLIFVGICGLGWIDWAAEFNSTRSVGR
jgi:quaternary ammonium compound-resistance protein SugE